MGLLRAKKGYSLGTKIKHLVGIFIFINKESSKYYHICIQSRNGHKKQSHGTISRNFGCWLKTPRESFVFNWLRNFLGSSVSNKIFFAISLNHPPITFILTNSKNPSELNTQEHIIIPKSKSSRGVVSKSEKFDTFLHPTVCNLCCKVKNLI